MVKYFLEFLKGEREQRDVIMSRALKSQTELLVQMAKLTQIIEHISADIDCEKREREKTRPRKPAPAD